MREREPAEDTRRVYGTLACYQRRHNDQQLVAPGGGVPYIWSLSTRTVRTYCLVSEYIPYFCTEYRPW